MFFNWQQGRAPFSIETADVFDDPETRIARMEAKVESLESVPRTTIDPLHAIADAVNGLSDRD